MHRKYKTDFLIVGSGVGAVGVLSELINSQKKIMVVEYGKNYIDWGEDIPNKAKNLYKEKGTFPESAEGIGYYRHLGIGGTLEVSCANGIKPPDNYLAEHGIDIREDLDHVTRELGVISVPETHIGKTTKKLTQSAQNLGLEMNPTPKFIDFEKCKMCALCELICPHNAKWSTVSQLKKFQLQENFTLKSNIEIEKIDFDGTRASMIHGWMDDQPITIEAEYIILAAGGLGTPVILQNSGINSGRNLHLDLYSVVYGRCEQFNSSRDIPMATFYKDPDDTFIIAPYMDIDIWYGLTHKGLSKWFENKGMAGMMVKIADQGSGRIESNGEVYKDVTERDSVILDQGIELSKQILLDAGATETSITVTKPRGAHPGGTAAIGQVVDKDLKVNGFDNLFVADAGVLPEALGKPPIMTIMALSKRLGKTLLSF